MGIWTRSGKLSRRRKPSCPSSFNWQWTSKEKNNSRLGPYLIFNHCYFLVADWRKSGNFSWCAPILLRQPVLKILVTERANTCIAVIVRFIEVDGRQAYPVEGVVLDHG